MNNNKYSKESFEGLEDNILDELFKNRKEADTFSPTNVYATIKVKKEESLKGCVKEISFKRINAHSKLEKIKTKVKLPKGLENGTRIILKNEGNYLENTKRSNLIVTVKIV